MDKHRREIRMLNKAKFRAIKNGLEFNIDYSDIVIPNICPVLGIPIDLKCDGYCDGSPSLDRIDNTKGYIKGNVIVISLRANTIKNNGNELEHLMIAEYIIKHKAGMLVFPKPIERNKYNRRFSLVVQRGNKYGFAIRIEGKVTFFSFDTLKDAMYYSYCVGSKTPPILELAG